MAEVLNEVWQAPARAQRLAGARAARKLSPEAPQGTDSLSS